MRRTVRPLTDDDLLLMLARRDEGADHDTIAKEVGATASRIVDALAKIDRDLARSERG